MALFSGVAAAGTLPPIRPVPHVDLPRFMGTWYMIAAIPTVFERDAWNAVETYTLQPDGNILTTLRFNKGAADGPLKQIHSTAYVHPGSGGAVWGVQVFWPIKAQYIVAWLKPDYSEMIVARDARDYTWVFARTPTLTAAEWVSLRTQVAAMGYDTSRLRKISQSRMPMPDGTPYSR
ncbi:lipocalin family protein [Rhodanobacter sp. DHG33]|uniref:lipocalin family protein n=1 Tax=Rhodanobacter sp. DHG33 TaxID=2775921 RepID=UPI001CE0DAC8|nr:lipocalin family protein [Rhodanobacter sp. DHG33]